jgi:LysR family transcriptional regulator, low CO2-responsive transcriptional regulator
VADLEQELGVKLFVRSGRRIAFTEAGRVLDAYAARVVSTIGDAQRAIHELDGIRRGFLVIGGSTTPGIYLLPKIIAGFQAKYPAVDLRLDIAPSRVIEERVHRNELALGIVGGHELLPSEQNGPRCRRGCPHGDPVPKRVT